MTTKFATLLSFALAILGSLGLLACLLVFTHVLNANPNVVAGVFIGSSLLLATASLSSTVLVVFGPALESRPANPRLRSERPRTGPAGELF